MLTVGIFNSKDFEGCAPLYCDGSLHIGLWPFQDGDLIMYSWEGSYCEDCVTDVYNKIKELKNVNNE